MASDRKNEAAVNLEVIRHKGLADESNLNLLGNLYMDRVEQQLALNKSESLDQYISRVRRAVDRQKQKDEREAGK